MKIVFIAGTQVLVDNQFVNSIEFTDSIAIIYFKDINLSYDYASEVAKKKEVCFFNDISVFFQQAKDDVYSFGFADYTVYVTKNAKEIFASFSSFESNLDTLDSFIKQTKIFSLIFQITKTKYNFIYLWIIIFKLFNLYSTN